MNGEVINIGYLHMQVDLAKAMLGDGYRFFAKINRRLRVTAKLGEDLIQTNDWSDGGEVRG